MTANNQLKNITTLFCSSTPVHLHRNIFDDWITIVSNSVSIDFVGHVANGE